MNCGKNVKNFIQRIFFKTYSKILDHENIERRINFIFNDSRVSPFNMMKSILYSDTSNELGKLAVDFRMNFITDNYEHAIINGISYEIDTISGEFGEKIRMEIKENCIILNHLLMKLYLESEIDIERAFESFENMLNVKYIKNIPLFWEFRDNISSLISKNQKSFMAVYGFDIEIESDLSEQSKKKLRCNYSDEMRCNIFEILKSKYNVIDIDLVRNIDFFG